MITTPSTPAGTASTPPGIAGPARGCHAVVSGERCTKPSVYRTWLDDCPVCRGRLAVLWCLGHPFCIDHAAAARTGAYEHTDDEATVVTVTRMTGLLETR